MQKTLYDINKGESAIIVDFISSDIMLDMARLGISAGEEVKCLEKFGNVVIQKNNQQIAIGKSLSKQILIEDIIK